MAVRLLLLVLAVASCAQTAIGSAGAKSLRKALSSAVKSVGGRGSMGGKPRPSEVKAEEKRESDER